MKFDFFYGVETEQFNFIRIPAIMLKDSRYRELSLQTIAVYSVLLNQTTLSMKNGWLDEDNRVYIIYPVKELMSDLRLSKSAVGKCLDELVEFGLLYKRRQGQGKPDLLYVKNFLASETQAEVIEDKTGEEDNVFVEEETCTAKKSENETSYKIQKSENQTSGSSKSGLLEVSNSDVHNSYINYNKTDINKSIYPSSANAKNSGEMDGLMDSKVNSEITAEEAEPIYRQMIKENVNFDLIEYKDHRLDEQFESGKMSLQEYEYEKKQCDMRIAERVLRYMLSVMCVESDQPIQIGEDIVSRDFVKKRLLMADYDLFKRVIVELGTNKAIRNPKGYAISMLYNG